MIPWIMAVAIVLVVVLVLNVFVAAAGLWMVMKEASRFLSAFERMADSAKRAGESGVALAQGMTAMATVIGEIKGFQEGQLRIASDVATSTKAMKQSVEALSEILMEASTGRRPKPRNFAPPAEPGQEAASERERKDSKFEGIGIDESILGNMKQVASI